MAKKKKLDMRTFYGGIYAPIADSIEKKLARREELLKELAAVEKDLYDRTAEYLFLRFPIRTYVKGKLYNFSAECLYYVSFYSRDKTHHITVPTMRSVRNGRTPYKKVAKTHLETAISISPDIDSEEE